MKSCEYIRGELSRVLKPSRYEHTLGVAAMAVHYAKKLRTNENSAYIAALLHDCAKYLTDEQLRAEAEKYGIPTDPIKLDAAYLLHGDVGARYAIEKYGVDDPDILNAIENHTLGREHMSVLEKIIYLADSTESGRAYPKAAALRELAEADFAAALLRASEETISYLLENQRLIHPQSIVTRNCFLRELQDREGEKNE